MVENKFINLFSFVREAHWEQKMNNVTDYFFWKIELSIIQIALRREEH